MKSFVVVTLLIIATTSSCSSSDSPRSNGSPSLVATDVAEQAGPGVAKATNTHGENCIADFDGDGTLDALLSTHAGVWPLLRGLPDGRFEPYYKGVGLTRRDRHGCAVADFDADGQLDVYFSIGACRGKCKAPKELWIQQADHTFVDEASQWGISDPGGRGRVPVVLNANGDKLPDLFTGQEKGVRYPSFNRLWINRGDHFELEQGPLTKEIGSVCAAAADIDGDGLDEIALCTPEDGFHLFRNKNGAFVDDTSSFGVDDYGRQTAKLVDLNGDRRPDLATVTRARMRVFLNEGGRYTRLVFDQKVTNGIDVAFGDVDADRDLDIYVQQGGSNPDRIFLNDGGGRRFTTGPSLPTPRGGSGDSVVAIPDWKDTGRAAFLVNNGFQEAVGARQLFEFTGK